MNKLKQKLAALTAIAAATGIIDLPKPTPQTKEVPKCIICGKTNSPKKGECCSKQCFLVAKERAKEALIPNAAEAWDMEKADLQKYERSLVNVKRD